MDLPSRSERFSPVVFDLDGTLVDSFDDLAEAVNAALAQCGCRQLPSALVRKFVGNGARSLVERSVGASQERVGSEDVDEVLRRFESEYAAGCLRSTRLYPGVEELLHSLGRKGFDLAVLTNKPRGFSQKILEGLGVGGLFYRVVGGDDFPARKPDPRGLHALAEEIGCEPSGGVLVGDSEVDLQTAVAGGMPFVGVTWGARTASELRSFGATRLVSAPGELPEALGAV